MSVAGYVKTNNNNNKNSFAQFKDGSLSNNHRI